MRPALFSTSGWERTLSTGIGKVTSTTSLFLQVLRSIAYPRSVVHSDTILPFSLISTDLDHPGMRTCRGNSAAASVPNLITTVPSHGYCVDCATDTFLPPIVALARLPTNRLI